MKKLILFIVAFSLSLTVSFGQGKLQKSEESLKETEAVDGARISNWYDINPQTMIKDHFKNTSETVSEHPTYKENCMNGLPCIYFHLPDSILDSVNDNLGINTEVFTIFTFFN